MMPDITQLGQVFTPSWIVSEMLQLRRNNGNVLEPSSGSGAFAGSIPNCVSIEIDARHCRGNTLNIDFFDYPVENKFDTVIGNPPYVRYQEIRTETRAKLQSPLFDGRTNLYLFFIEKCLRHLTEHGELIFITPRDFLKATSGIKLNQFLYQQGTITEMIDLGDKKVFDGATPNCLIWRFEKNNFSRRTNKTKEFLCCNGQLLFTDTGYPFHFRDLFSVKVGAVSGNDKIFTSEEFGNAEFVCSETYKTGKTRKMIFNVKNDYLEQYKDILIRRKIKPFDETNWWMWGRVHCVSERKRIYVNCRTRHKQPFFVHPCSNYDGSLLAVFPHNQKADVHHLCTKLNAVNWFELGFICGGRYLFSQKSLENAPLPEFFRDDIDDDIGGNGIGENGIAGDNIGGDNITGDGLF